MYDTDNKIGEKKLESYSIDKSEIFDNWLELFSLAHGVIGGEAGGSTWEKLMQLYSIRQQPAWLELLCCTVLCCLINDWIQDAASLKKFHTFW